MNGPVKDNTPSLSPTAAIAAKAALIPAAVTAAVFSAGEVGDAAMKSQGASQSDAATFRDGGMAAIATLLSLTILGNIFISNQKLRFFSNTYLAGLLAFFSMQAAQGIEVGSEEWDQNAKIIIPLLFGVLTVKNLLSILMTKLWPNQFLASAAACLAVEVAAIQAGGRLITASGAMSFDEGANAFSAMIVTASPFIIALFLVMAAIDRRTVKTAGTAIALNDATKPFMEDDSAGLQLAETGGTITPPGGQYAGPFGASRVAFVPVGAERSLNYGNS